MPAALLAHFQGCFIGEDQPQLLQETHPFSALHSEQKSEPAGGGWKPPAVP
jgi:hypothetical protein